MAKIRRTVSRFFKRLSIRRQYKDALFQRCFQDKADLLDLYNALNGTAYEDTDALKINTLDDCIYMSYRNDLSFIISATLNLYEHQASYNPNMPIRGLVYFSRLYEAYIKENRLNIYSRTLVPLPTPKYVIFYNGQDKQPDIRELRLSDAFLEKDGSTPALECVATMLNIHYGHNMELLNKCKRLHDYAYFVGEVNGNMSKGYSLEKSVELAMNKCEDNDILADIIGKHRSEVFHMLLFDRKLYEQGLREEGREDGKLQDRAEVIIELLEDIGEPSEALQNIIMEQTDMQTLREWFKIARRAQSVEYFEEQIGLVSRD